MRPPTGANPLPIPPPWDTENLLRRNKGRLNFLSAAGDYIAVPVEGEEYARVVSEWPIQLGMRFLMGFSPRNLLRLDPHSLR